jgi:hypothetical protein
MAQSTSVARKIAVWLGLGFLLIGGFAGTLVNGSRTQLLMWLVVGAALAGWASYVSRGYKRQLAERGAPVRGGLESLAKTFFDSPGELSDGYDSSVTDPATTITRQDSDLGWTAVGTCGGARVAIASLISELGREQGESWHTYSYVCVDLQGLDVWFHMTRPELGLLLGRHDPKNEAKIGEPAFDEAWNILANEDVARAVLDDSVRARLGELRIAVSDVSQYVGAMTILASRHGLALRWPGELTPERAAFIRDLLLDMRRNLLLHVSRQAAQAAAPPAVAYRVADEPAEPLDEEAAEEPARRARTLSNED